MLTKYENILPPIVGSCYLTKNFFNRILSVLFLFSLVIIPLGFLHVVTQIWTKYWCVTNFCLSFSQWWVWSRKDWEHQEGHSVHRQCRWCRKESRSKSLFLSTSSITSSQFRPKIGNKKNREGLSIICDTVDTYNGNFTKKYLAEEF